MTAHPYYGDSNYVATYEDRHPVSTPDQVAVELEAWDRGDGKADGHWCPVCGIHRTQHPNHLCPVCADRAVAS